MAGTTAPPTPTLPNAVAPVLSETREVLVLPVGAGDPSLLLPPLLSSLPPLLPFTTLDPVPSPQVHLCEKGAGDSSLETGASDS